MLNVLRKARRTCGFTPVKFISDYCNHKLGIKAIQPSRQHGPCSWTGPQSTQKIYDRMWGGCGDFLISPASPSTLRLRRMQCKK